MASIYISVIKWWNCELYRTSRRINLFRGTSKHQHIPVRIEIINLSSKSLGFADIIGIHAGGILTTSQIDELVQCSAETAVLSTYDPDASVFGSVTTEYLQRPIRAAIVDDQQLKIVK